ncbi:hypothetical protein LZD49_35050 [Dyadobacter sp. CY261]|uniref:hypothetical protein n=1 Tax=Dyadobacter sp. CY261 TaxID=2907203 RepID=UPI001F264AE0|nr:hypothetical protein [Dyadobacter sp. CY261]MCF0075742.1 hypothetical protein [Dyadobacter sp. CY261]
MINQVKIEELNDKGKKVLIFTVIPDLDDNGQQARRNLKEKFDQYRDLGIAYDFFTAGNPYQIVVIEGL